MEKFDKMSGNDSRGELLRKTKLYGCHKANSEDIVEDAGINSPIQIMGLLCIQ
jgi:hypothetical protein